MRRQGLRSLGWLAVTALAVGIVISRRPDAFTNPQFWAEDGAQWFQNAYNQGPWQALFVSYQGHFLVQPRLVAVIASPFGVANAPLIYNLFGLAFQVAPVLFFLSGRFRPVLPSLWVRGALGAVYLLMPSTEINVTVGAAQFHLVLLATLVLIAPPSPRWGWRAFDAATVALCALTGGFVYILLPCALLWWCLRRQRWTGALVLILAVGLVLQIWSLFLGPRGSYPLGASASYLLLIVCDRVILAGLFAEEGTTHVFVSGLPHATVIAALVCLAALPVVLLALLRAPWELRLFDLVAAGIAAAGLIEPLVSSAGNQWQIMATTNSGERYFFMAQVAWVVTVLWAACLFPRRWLRGGAWALAAAAFASGLVASWQYPPFVNYDWPAEAHAIEAAAPGTHVSVPINPGPPWEVSVKVH